MDIVDCLLESHGVLRASLDSLSALLGQPCGAGWDDRLALDKERLSREFRSFLAAFKAHEAVEDAFLSRVLRQLELDPELDADIAEGHRSVEEMTRLFGTIIGCCDGEHVYRVRSVLARLGEELERHLSYEEKQVFPKFRERLPAALLQELGRRARAAALV